MKKIFYILPVAICLLIVLSACTNKKSDTDSLPNYQDTYNTESSNAENTDNATLLGLTAEECSEGLYIKSDNRFYSVNTQIYYTSESGSKAYDSIMGIGMLKENDCPVLDSTSQKLAIFSDVDEIQYRAIPVTKKGYCAQEIIDATGHNFDEDYQILYKISSNQKGFDSLNGNEILNMSDLKSFAEENDIILHQEPEATKRYSFLFSENKKNIEAVCYSGTQKTDYDLKLDTPSVLVDKNKAVTLNTEKTDEGYFYLNVSNLDKGYYVIALRYGAVLKDHCFLIEIK